METFVIAFTAKAGSEEIVSKFYTAQQASYEQAPGFINRLVLRSKPGTMVAAVRKYMSEEEMAKHPEPHNHDAKAIHFVIVEQWESVDQRMDYSRSRDKKLDAELFPHLLPKHSHEFYSDITPK